MQIACALRRAPELRARREFDDAQADCGIGAGALPVAGALRAVCLV
jgi:hypothetical protein